MITTPISRTQRVILELVEPRRRSLGLSLREAAYRADMSEANWRQLVKGEGNAGVQRTARVDQVLDMARAAECLHPAAVYLGASREEEEAARERGRKIMSPAEREIMSLRNLDIEERVYLVRAHRVWMEEHGA